MGMFLLPPVLDVLVDAPGNHHGYQGVEPRRDEHQGKAQAHPQEGQGPVGTRGNMTAIQLWRRNPKKPAGCPKCLRNYTKCLFWLASKVDTRFLHKACWDPWNVPCGVRWKGGFRASNQKGGKGAISVMGAISPSLSER